MMKLGSCAAALLLAANLAAADRQLFSIARGGAVFAPFNKTDKVRTVGNRLSLELPPKGGRWQGTIITPKKGEQYFDLSEGAILAVDVKNNNPYMMQLQMEIVNLKEGKDSNAFAHIAYWVLVTRKNQNRQRFRQTAIIIQLISGQINIVQLVVEAIGARQAAEAVIHIALYHIFIAAEPVISCLVVFKLAVKASEGNIL